MSEFFDSMFNELLGISFSETRYAAFSLFIYMSRRSLAWNIFCFEEPGQDDFSIEAFHRHAYAQSSSAIGLK